MNSFDTDAPDHLHQPAIPSPVSVPVVEGPFNAPPIQASTGAGSGAS
jgi:hypothetical protein